MAWKPPTQKAFDAGEIPHKKVISAAEQANLDSNRPKKNVEAMFGGNPSEIVKQLETLPATQQEKLDRLLPVGSGQTISDWLEKLKDTKDFGVRVAVLARNYETEMMAEVSSSHKSFLVSEVLKISYLKELLPIMFYFGMGIIDDVFRVVVTPIPDWEEIQMWDVSDISDNVVPNFLTKVKASVYEFDTSMNPSQVRREMIKLGFIEKHEIIP